MGFFNKAKTGTGLFLQIIGMVIFWGGGFAVLIWTLYVLFENIGIWTIFVGLLLAPITYLASILIVWFTSDSFPYMMLIPYFASYVGIAIASLGEKIKDETKYDSAIDSAIKQKLTIKHTEALYGTKKLIIINGKQLEVNIQPGTKNGTLVRVNYPLKIIDGNYDDLFVQIHVKKSPRFIYMMSTLGVIAIIILTIFIVQIVTNNSSSSSSTTNTQSVDPTQSLLVHYENTDFNFCIDYPEDWIFEEIGPNGFGIKPNDSEYNQIQVSYEHGEPILDSLTTSQNAIIFEAYIKFVFDIIGASNLNISINEPTSGKWDWAICFTMVYNNELLNGCTYIKETDTTAYTILILQISTSDWNEGFDVVNSFYILE